jgi:hypothetical protein
MAGASLITKMLTPSTAPTPMAIALGSCHVATKSIRDVEMAILRSHEGAFR